MLPLVIEMKCNNCIYYKSGYMENECLAFDFYNYPDTEECDLVDNNFNLVKDDMGNDYFESREHAYNRIKEGWRKLDLNKKYDDAVTLKVKDLFPVDINEINEIFGDDEDE